MPMLELVAIMSILHLTRRMDWFHSSMLEP